MHDEKKLLEQVDAALDRHGLLDEEIGAQEMGQRYPLWHLASAMPQRSAILERALKKDDYRSATQSVLAILDDAAIIAAGIAKDAQKKGVDVKGFVSDLQTFKIRMK